MLDESGREVVLTMGCYGIGVSRVVAAAIEQHHDERGIVWPEAIAPYQLALLPMNPHKSEAVRETAERLYRELVDAGIEVLLDDRGERAGVMFADMELIGIPHRIVVGDRGLKKGVVEYKGRRDTGSVDVPLDEVVAHVRERLAGQAPAGDAGRALPS